MAERRIIVDNLKLSYNGLFNATELYQLIDNWLREKGYDKREIRNQEHVTKEGKYVELEMQPWKKITDYANTLIRVEIKIFKLTEVTIQSNGKKIRMNKGRLNIRFDGYLETDYEHRWEQRPIYFFIRTLFDKFVYASYTHQFENEIAENVNQLYDVVRGFLNLYKITAQQESTFVKRQP